MIMEFNLVFAGQLCLILIVYYVGLKLSFSVGRKTGYHQACKNHDILTEKDAERFMDALNNPVKLSSEEVEDIKASYELLKTISDFDRERDEEESNMNKPIFENEEAANSYHFEIVDASQDRLKQAKIHTKIAKEKGFIKS